MRRVDQLDQRQAEVLVRLVPFPVPMGVRHDGDATGGHDRQTMTPPGYLVRALVPPGRWPAGPDLPPGPTLPDVWSARWAARPDGARPGRRLGPPPGLSTAPPWPTATARVAGALAAAGVAPGDRVLWSARATLESVQVLLGVLRAGAVLVTVSPSASAAEVEHFVADCTPGARPDRRRRRRRAACRPSVPPASPVLTIDELLDRAASPSLASDEHDLPPSSPTRCRRPHRLHLGHHRAAQGSGAHPRLAAGRRRRAGPGLGLAERRPPPAGPAALPRARAGRRPLRHAGRRRLGRGLRPLRRGGDRRCGRRRVGRPCSSACPPCTTGLAASGRAGAPGRAAPLRVRLGPSGRRAVARPAAARASRCWSATA